MSRNNETSGVELVVVGIFAFCLAVVAWLMKTFDVEWQTALETAPSLIVWLLVVGAGIFFGIKMETGLVRWGAPLAIALLIPVFKPILKEAAGVRETGGLVFDDMVSWYGTGWGMSLMFFRNSYHRIRAALLVAQKKFISLVISNRGKPRFNKRKLNPISSTMEKLCCKQLT